MANLVDRLHLGRIPKRRYLALVSKNVSSKQMHLRSEQTFAVNNTNEWRQWIVLNGEEVADRTERPFFDTMSALTPKDAVSPDLAIDARL